MSIYAVISSGKKKKKKKNPFILCHILKFNFLVCSILLFSWEKPNKFTQSENTSQGPYFAEMKYKAWF